MGREIGTFIRALTVFYKFTEYLCTDMPINTNGCFWLPDFWVRLGHFCFLALGRS